MLVGQTMQPPGSFHLMGIAGVLQTQKQGSELLVPGLGQGRLPEEAAPEWF